MSYLFTSAASVAAAAPVLAFDAAYRLPSLEPSAAIDVIFSSTFSCVTGGSLCQT